MKNKIVLMGYMGSGKSTIARLLAVKLNYVAIDLDSLIEQRTGMKIPEIFKQKGEIYFRKLESRFLNELLQQKKQFVLALGGGTPCYAYNIKIIKNQAFSVYINLPVATLVDRLKTEKEQRPLVAHLNNKDLTEFVAKHLFERQTYYNEAQIIIHAKGLSLENICNKIIKQLG